MCFLVAAACWTLVALPAAEADVTPLSPHEAGAILGAGNEACSDDACNWGCIYGQGGFGINQICGEKWHAGGGDAGWRCVSGTYVCTPSGTPASWTIKRCYSNMLGDCVYWQYGSCTGEGSNCTDS
jgi:hypothetical protein